MTRIAGLTLAAVVALTVEVRADFSYEQTTKITGGAIADTLKMAGPFAAGAREPVKSTVLVKGNRMAHVTKDSMSIVDVDARTITNVDLSKKTYSVMTFEEMKQAFAAMQKRMGDNQSEMQVRVDVKETGAKKTIAGFETRELVTTIVMENRVQGSTQPVTTEVVSNAWLADEIQGYGEVRKFYQNMAETVDWVPGGGMPMAQPGMREGMARLYRESAKLEGVPVLQITRVNGQGMPNMPSMTGVPPPAGGTRVETSSSGGNTTPTDAAVEAAQRSAQQEAIWQASRAGGAAGRIGGAALGGMLGGLGRKKQPKTQPQPQVQEPSQMPGGGANPPVAGTGANAPVATSSNSLLMESTTEMTSHSSAAIDGSRMSVPPGFQKVESEMMRLVRDQK